MVGSAQNIALPNIVLNTAVAKVFRDYADSLEKCGDIELEAKKLIRENLKAHRRIIFGGNGYSKEWPVEAERRGLLNLKTSPDAYACLTDEKNVELFTSFSVMSAHELFARQMIMYETYSHTLSIEAKTMVDIARSEIVPAIERYLNILCKNAKLKADIGLDKHAMILERELIDKLSLLSYSILPRTCTKVKAQSLHPHILFHRNK